MDFGIIAAILMLAIWAFITFTTTAPGWIHILLTMGMFLLMYRIVVRGTRGRETPPKEGQTIAGCMDNRGSYSYGNEGPATAVAEQPLPSSADKKKPVLVTGAA